MVSLQESIEHLKTFDVHLFKNGNNDFTLFGLAWLLVLVSLVFILSGAARRWIVQRALTHTQLDIGTRQAIGALTRYVLLFVGLLVVMQTAGIDLTTFSVLAGAIGVGVGFGLQNIISNFVSGLIIMLERPIKVGDRIEVSGVEGDVIEIGVRRTTLLANNDVAIIVPNSKLVTENVRNWEYSSAQKPMTIAVSVVSACDPRAVEEVLLEVAHHHEGVSDKPAPRVYFKTLSGASFSFELVLWSTRGLSERAALINDLNFAIYDRFAARNLKLA